LGAVADGGIPAADVAAVSGARGSNQPVGAEEFTHLMARLGPFERPPRLAVAVSGGADSLALALLAHHWARQRGGSVLALTVDHGLRPESAAEADRVGQWLAIYRIAHHVIRWQGDKPRTGIQEKARAARYALLFGRCQEHGILHLLTGHHRDDQSETVRMRIERGSGPIGLAGMSDSIPANAARLLRPLLEVPKARLEATLIARGQVWIDDPSNRNPAYARARLRHMTPADSGAGVDAAVDLGRRMGVRQAENQVEVARALVDCATLMPEGYAYLDMSRLVSAPNSAAMGCLDRLIRSVGGNRYPIAHQPLERLCHEVRAGLNRRRSLGGCLIAPRGRGLLVMREPDAMQRPMTAEAGTTVTWDRRFELRLGGAGTGLIGPLGATGWTAVRKDVNRPPMPAEVAVTLPALIDDQGVAAVPHLGFRRASPLTVESVQFVPASPLTGAFWAG
jgi:tRNA(Ile)-lysidine synthase